MSISLFALLIAASGLPAEPAGTAEPGKAAAAPPATAPDPAARRPRVSATRGAVASAGRTGAAPAAPLQSLVRPEDYPASALAGREEGRPSFRIAVGADGRVAGCVILVSSGSSALDGTTCRLLRERARFTPARDAAGNPVADQYFGQLAWRVPR